MRVIQLREQLQENTPLQQNNAIDILPYIEDGKDVVFSVKRGRENDEVCLKLFRKDDTINATGSYFVGIDWLK